MFETALIRPHGSGIKNVDAGILAETLIFYNKIHVVANRSLLTDLLKVIPPQDFLSLIESNRLSLSYSKQSNAVASTKTNLMEEYSFVSISFAKTADRKRITKNDEIREAVSSIMGFSRASRKVTEGLIARTIFIDRFAVNNSIDIAHAELDDGIYLHSAIESLVNRLVPAFKLPRNWEFRPLYIGESFTIITDLDFDDINREYHKYVPVTDNSITPAYLLNLVLSARMDAIMAADYMSEIITNDEISDLIRLKISTIINRREKSRSQIDIFQETTLNDCRKIREAINSGERTFKEFLTVLERASRFKKWLSDQNTDANLLTEYYRSVTSNGPMSSLPAKAMRYVATTVAGVASPMAGLVSGAADEFFVDKLFRGWRPNHFVDGPLRKFSSVD